MKYISFDRIITFSVGVVLIYLSTTIFGKAPQYVYENIFYVLSIFILLLGIYITIAALIPYRKTTKGVAEIVYEGLAHIFIEIIFRGIIRIFMTIFNGIVHFFSHL